MLVLPFCGGQIGPTLVRAGALPITCAAADELSLVLPLDRPSRFMASSVGLPKPLEGARGRVGGGSPAELVVELRPFAITILRAAPVAVMVGTDFLELSARLLPL